jgi:hypothetical protein
MTGNLPEKEVIEIGYFWQISYKCKKIQKNTKNTKGFQQNRKNCKNTSEE